MPIISGGGAAAATGGGVAVLFNSLLAAPAASIDTGAAGIAPGHSVMVAYVIVQTADAGATAAINITFNNDGGANYDSIASGNAAGVGSVGNALGATSYNLGAHGAGGTAQYPSPYVLTFQSYDATTFFKVGVMLGGRPDATGGNVQAFENVLGYRSTAAISRMAVTGATANLAAGSRLTILGYN